jgi:hypothetical protein
MNIKFDMKDPHWAEPSYGWWAKKLYENYLEVGGKRKFFCRWAELNRLPIKMLDAKKLVKLGKGK